MSEDKTEGTEEERSAFYDAVQARYKEIGNVLWGEESAANAPEGTEELWKILASLAAVTQAMASTISLLGECKLISTKNAGFLQAAHQAVVEDLQAAMAEAAEKDSADDA